MKIEKRQQIAKRFLQTVLWIDDDINMGDDPDGHFQKFFRPASKTISKEGMICQLFGFTNSKGEEDPYGGEGISELEIIKGILPRADIVIVDWFLGANDPSNSIKIINDILLCKGTRFCVVLSKETKLEEHFAENYADKLLNKGSYLCNREGSKFFILLSKIDFQNDQLPNLIPSIISIIAETYQDYLHWLAIEIMANVKDEIPTLLENLPKDTDRAFMADHLLDDLKTSLDFATSAIGEDIYDVVTEMRLESLLTCCEQFEADESFTLLKAKLIEEAARERNRLPDVEKDKIPEDKVFENKGVRHKIIKTLELQKNYNYLTKLLEQKSLDQHITSRVFQGAVYGNQGEPSKIWICVSQACDCNTKGEVFLLKAKLDRRYETTAPGRTFVSFNHENYVTIPGNSYFSTQKVTDPNNTRSGLDGLKYLGGLRSSVAMRIADRFFAHQTRIGVNQPSIIRELRSNS